MTHPRRNQNVKDQVRRYCRRNIASGEFSVSLGPTGGPRGGRARGRGRGRGRGGPGGGRGR